MEESDKSADHDNIVTLIAEVRQVRTDIKDLKDGTSTTITDHENRLRSLEKWVWKAIGGLLVLDFIFGILVAYYSSKK